MIFAFGLFHNADASNSAERYSRLPWHFISRIRVISCTSAQAINVSNRNTFWPENWLPFQRPASAFLKSSHFASTTSLSPATVRPWASSWKTIKVSSASILMSVSTHLNPSCLTASNARRVFSGNFPDIPLCAITLCGLTFGPNIFSLKGILSLK